MRTKRLVTLCLILAMPAIGCAPSRGGVGFMDGVAALLGEQSPEALAAQRAKTPGTTTKTTNANQVSSLASQASGPVASATPTARPGDVQQAGAMQPGVVTPAKFDRCCDACESNGACETACGSCPLCPLEACGKCAECLRGRRCKLFTRPQPGPPPVSYVPPLPPKFLPVPTRPTLSPARPGAPDSWRGDVELGWRTGITSPGRD